MKSINTTLIILAVIVSPSAGQQDDSDVRGLIRKGRNNGGMGMQGVPRHGGMKGMMGGFTPDADFVPTGCTGAEGICGLMGPDTGILVCRTFGERSFKTCIDPEESIGAGDVCGCCGEDCPLQTECKTSCDVVPGGVLVNKTRRNGRVEARCVSPLDAVTLLLRNNAVCA
eukprot:CAMPEP_0119014712 /NCGR_PEP_ID=MMETSP1176-20130426/10263_1 /TAXON_ID=265551 /ORGANISM="Synedropsis recta cf, Strain CCMP1620" /LENGTH=169 /DNA_ID=CAMNT_0006967935 /DNA_START=81 /DNA_END=590 /DNA_ORIENTATION=+